MIILTKEMLLEKNTLTSLISKEKDTIDNNIKFQQKIKDILLEYMQKFADSTNNIIPDYSDTILGFLDNLKNSLQFTNNSIDLLNELLDLNDNLLLDVENNNFELTSDYIDDFNSKCIEINLTASENMIPSSSFLYSILNYSELIFESKKSDTEIDSNSKEVSKEAQIPQVSENIENETTDNTKNTSDINKDNEIKKVEEISSFDMQENTLIISEIKKKVFLPYYIQELNNILNNEPDKYSNLEDVILQNYTLPFSMFKNLSIARFREAFKLMRNKEKKSIKSAFDLGMELLFNYNLHPAIISACKNLDELDIYLDYLDNNETDKFDLFNIKFEVAPVLVKEKKMCNS